MVAHLLNDLSFPIRLASIIQNEKLMSNSPFQIDKKAHYEADYLTFFITVIET